MKLRANPLFYIALFLFFIISILAVVRFFHKDTPSSRAPAKGLIAVVIDDWGYSLNNIPVAEEIKYPLTCAVLPNLKNSYAASSRLKASGFEIILHLPMQPREKYRLEKDTITLNADKKELKRILDQDLASVAFAEGISNHMGSLVTEDSRVSGMILEEAKSRGLYFLDSYVTADSVCPVLARRINTRFAKRDVFLDNKDDMNYIRSQVARLESLAEKNGKALGIGHDRKNTLLVLKEEMPKLAKKGYKFVFVSEIAK